MSLLRLRSLGYCIVWIFCAAINAAAVQAADPAEPPNVLFIAVDDLRPVLGCYGHTIVKTPHLDRLAASAVVFQRAYCQLPSCCPSRTSVLTGLRPKSTKVTSNGSPHFRKFLPDHVTLPQHFQAHGYFCKSLGKVFHLRDKPSWSEDEWVPEAVYPIYGAAENLQRQQQIRATRKPADWWGHGKWIKAASWEASPLEDDELFDGRVAAEAIRQLRRKREKPFFLAVGFFRPHLPFIAPKRYFDLYPPDSMQLPDNRQPPRGAPECAVHNSPESRSYSDISRSGKIAEAKQRELLRAYYASVSFVDAQIGRVLGELERLGLREKTVVVIWSDHGYHHGEHGLWNKLTNFEEATRSTLLIAAPGHSGGTAQGLVELVDLYPTLCELCGLPVPDGLEGTSLRPLLKQPGRNWKSAVFSQADPRRAMGYSMRTDRYRYVQWHRGGERIAVEVYDHRHDPGENVNLAADPASARIVEQLQQQFARGWQAALPSD